jgi:superfamily II DNA/RNA helicase
LGQTDVEDIKFVINFDYPNSSEDYVHRIGRTARANNTGTAYTFFTQNNCKQAVDLINVLREANQQVNPKLVQLGESARFLGKGMSCRKYDYYFYILARKPNLENIFIYSSKFFHNFHLSESSFTCPGLRASGLG